LHIPDGFLNGATMATTAAASAGGLGAAIKIAGRKLGERQVPLMGMMAAFIFAAQMLNFPVAGGTSGHVIGAAMATILLGPWASVVIMSLVLSVQCLVFQDGGLLALGANIFNMAIVASLVAYATYRVTGNVLGSGRRSQLIAGFAAAWCSVLLAAVACSLELSASAVAPLGVVLPAMAGIHALIGVGEGLATAAVLSLVIARRADLVKMGAPEVVPGIQPKINQAGVES
jgi:cobalt/nickel transport system permease protein